MASLFNHHKFFDIEVGVVPQWIYQLRAFCAKHEIETLEAEQLTIWELRELGPTLYMTQAELLTAINLRMNRLFDSLFISKQAYDCSTLWC